MNTTRRRARALVRRPGDQSLRDTAPRRGLTPSGAESVMAKPLAIAPDHPQRLTRVVPTLSVHFHRRRVSSLVDASTVHQVARA